MSFTPMRILRISGFKSKQSFCQRASNWWTLFPDIPRLWMVNLISGLETRSCEAAIHAYPRPNDFCSLATCLFLSLPASVMESPWKRMVFPWLRRLDFLPRPWWSAFAKGIAVTGEENPSDVIFQSIVFMTPTNEKVADAFRESTGSIKVPSQKIVS